MTRRDDPVNGSYAAAQQRALEAALARGQKLRCPQCNTALTARAVQAPAEVAYVRRRVWVICPACRRSASLDIKP
jgi:uncharacterized protein with PIN domain